jgi:hypothetical protein
MHQPLQKILPELEEYYCYMWERNHVNLYLLFNLAMTEQRVGSPGSRYMPVPSATAPMGIYDRRNHPLADTGARGAVWGDPFRYMASGSGAAPGFSGQQNAAWN